MENDKSYSTIAMHSSLSSSSFLLKYFIDIIKRRGHNFKTFDIDWFAIENNNDDNNDNVNIKSEELKNSNCSSSTSSAEKNCVPSSAFHIPLSSYEYPLLLEPFYLADVQPLPHSNGNSLSPSTITSNFPFNNSEKNKIDPPLANNPLSVAISYGYIPQKLERARLLHKFILENVFQGKINNHDDNLKQFSINKLFLSLSLSIYSKIVVYFFLYIYFHLFY